MLDLLALVNNNLIFENKYLIKYQNLIIKNKSTKKIAFKTQVHHIIPKAAFKFLNLEIDDTKANKINLFYKDHILAHYYLAKCSIGKFKYDNILALRHILGHKRCDITEEELLKQLPDIQQLYEEAMKLQAIKMHNEKTGKKFTDIHKQRISEANKGRIYIHNEKFEKIINPEDFSYYQSIGFIKGRLHKPSAETKALMSLHMRGIKKATTHTRELLSKKVLGSK